MNRATALLNCEQLRRVQVTDAMDVLVDIRVGG